MRWRTAEKTARRFVRALALAGGAGLLLAVAATCLSILGRLCRRALNSTLGAEHVPAALAWVGPILGEEELVQYAVGFALFAALPWATWRQAHIAVDLFGRHMRRQWRNFFNLLGGAALLMVSYLLLTRQWGLLFRRAGAGEEALPALLLAADWGGIAARMRLHEESQILGLKLWPMHLAAELCIGALLVAAAFCLLRAARRLAAGRGGG